MELPTEEVLGGRGFTASTEAKKAILKRVEQIKAKGTDGGIKDPAQISRIEVAEILNDEISRIRSSLIDDVRHQILQELGQQERDNRDNVLRRILPLVSGAITKISEFKQDLKESENDYKETITKVKEAEERCHWDTAIAISMTAYSKAITRLNQKPLEITEILLKQMKDVESILRAEVGE